MKCKNCGANYKTREVTCPYCGMENAIGKSWLKQRKDAWEEYAQTRDEVAKKGPVYVADKVANRLLVVLILLPIVFLAGLVVFSLSMEIHDRAYVSIHRGELEEEMKKEYNAGELTQLDLFMSKYNLFGEEYYTYSQAVLLHNCYQSYMTDKMCFLNLSEEEKMKDEYYLEYAIKNGRDVYLLNIGIYSELDPANEALHQEYQDEILSFYTGVLGMSREEIDLVLDEDNFFTTDDQKSILAAIKERRAWE